MDRGEAGHRPAQGRREDRLPVSRPGPTPRDGTRGPRHHGALSSAHRRAAAGPGAWPRPGRPGLRHRDRGTALSADPAADAGKGPAVRDRVPRPGRRGLLVHLRLTRPGAIPWSNTVADSRALCMSNARRNGPASPSIARKETRMRTMAVDGDAGPF